jgi:acyl-CoA reductase-like NAD-dependent aldehyde dehydrogenase
MSVNATISYNPITGKVLGNSPIHSKEALRSMILKARKAQPIWAQLPVKQRAKKIQKIGEYITDNADKISETIANDNGKVRIDALASEVLPAVISVCYYCKKAPQFLREKSISPSSLFLFYKRSKIVRVPWGVIAVISPWNYPFSIPFMEVIMGLLAGNAVILKTATETQMVGQTLKDCFAAAELPKGIFSYVNISGKIAGETFLAHGIDKLFFTGSTNVGKSLMAKAAETLTPLNLELGGNDAMLVCPDADLDRATSGALWAGFHNGGQSCGGVERIYVHEDIYVRFLALLKKRIENLRVGHDINFDVDLGAMTTKEQIETVEAHIQEAISKGAKLFAQSPLIDNPKFQNLMPAMILTDVDHNMSIMREETFGPVVAVKKVTNMEEAIDLANDSCFGLTGSVWSKNKKKAETYGRKIKAGAITINDHLMSHGLAETPWGGFKQSGIGRCHGEIGFDEMTQTQVIVQDIFHFLKKQFWWYHYSKSVYTGLRGVLDLFYAKKILKRISGLFAAIKLIPRIFEKD